MSIVDKIFQARGFYRLLSSLLGLQRTIRCVRQAEGSSAKSLLDNLVALLDLHPIVAGINNVPEAGPVIFVANHPSGILDGLVSLSILLTRRSDVRIIANRLFSRFESRHISDLLIPVNSPRDSTREVRGTREIQKHLASGHAVLVFPAGWVASSIQNSIPVDHVWKSSIARIAINQNYPLVPIFIETRNSRLFYFLRRLSTSAGGALLLWELQAKRSSTIKVYIGRPISEPNISAEELTCLLRHRAYELKK